MQDLSEMLKKGCKFCKKALTVEAAKSATMQIKIVGTEVWSEPIPILCCEDCFKRESEVSH